MRLAARTAEGERREKGEDLEAALRRAAYQASSVHHVYGAAQGRKMAVQRERRECNARAAKDKRERERGREGLRSR